MKAHSLFGLTNALIVVALLLTSCSLEPEQQQKIYESIAIEASDECHLCGMLITRFDGPKGELYRKQRGDTVYKFCSTRDLFSYYLDPENKRNVTQILVHDMSKMPWDATNDEYFIDAKQAWYVVGSQKKGAMGKTLASFRERVDALVFTEKFGGKILSFSQIDYDALM